MKESAWAGIPEKIWGLIPGFLKNVRRDFQLMKQALAKRDFAGLALLAHRLEGDGASYSFDKLSDYGRRLKKAVQAENGGTIQECLQEMDRYLAEVGNLIEDSQAKEALGGKYEP